jgi:Tfp pilus tip-associated adhesin PilY1
MPGKSLLPAITGWLAPAIRGLFAMAPPPPPPGPCPGIPSGYTGGLLECSPCPYDATRQCAFVDTNGDGVIDPGEPAPSNLIPLPASPVFMRGFDDPQADPDSTLVLVQRIEVRFVRGDLYSLPPVFTSNDTLNGNPPWGSCPTATAGCPAAPDNDADAQVDPSSVADRHNQGMFSAIYDKERPRPTGQFPNDAFGGPSCPLGIVGCDPYVQDCGGYAHFNSYKGYPASAPTGLTTPYLYPSNPPASPDDWPVVPFRREWLGTDYPGGNSPESAIKRLLRFSSSIVSYNYGAPADSAYSLAENANEVAVTAPGTPIAGTLLDAYNYFVNTVFQPPTSGAPDPAIDCRNYIIVFVTDGHDECGSDPCSGGLSGLGPSGDLGQVLLPESTAGARAAAAANDPSIRTTGVPVYVVGLNSNAAFFPALQCVADNSGGQLFAATDRTQLQAALESILDFKRNASFFASPSSPAFAGGLGDTAQIGSVVPSHLNPNGDLSSWSVWSGTVKSFQLDANGLIPVVTAGAPTTTPTPSGPTNTPSVSTPTPTPTPLPGSGFFVDETNPDDTDPAARKPVWSAGRVLGYTDPVANLAAGAVPSAASPASRAPAIDVWPGRKMIFSRGTGAAIPMQRADFLPNTGTCVGAGTPGSCFDDLMTNMNLIPTSSVANQTLARLTVQFLRGGATTFGSRDEILNDASIRPATIGVIGPGVGEEQKFSYFYQDDAPSPGEPPQVRTDDDGTPPAGYAHKLGDIFHSEPMVIEPPQYYQYLVANLTPTGTTTPQPYLDFANLHAKRRKVLYVGANDGFFHAFDSGVWGRDTTNFPAAHDLGTGREIFAYSPRSVMGSQMPNLLDFPPLPQYFVDGSPSSADVFIDPAFAGTPDPTERVWRTILVSGLRQGGEGYFALDVTQPDDIVTAAGPTLGEIVGNKDAVPACLNGGGGSCNAGAASNRPYPSILWEFADAGATCSDGCATVATALGETWSKPVIGRIRLFNDPGPPAVFEDRYVAIFGGGYDPGFTQGDDVATRLPNGRALYIVDVETGDILYKTTEGAAGGSGTPVNFAPMPSAPGVIDYDDDGYLDAVYIGDVNGNMWRLSLVPDAPNGVGDVSSGQISGYQPFLLFNGCGALSGACPNRWPIFFEPGVIFLGGSVNPPTLGIAFGTGNRAELAQPNAFTQEFFYVVDTGQTATTFQRTDLHDLTPPNAPCPLPYDPVACAGAQNGFVLDFASQNEKTTSTVFSTFGNLSVITFTPDSVSPCATNGSSYRYVFFFLTGQGAYDADGAGNPGIYGDYVQTMGPGVAVSNQSISQSGGMHQTTMVEDELLQEQEGNVQTLERNWKEQQ